MNPISFLQDNFPLVTPDKVPSPKEELSMLKNLPLDELLDKLVHGIVSLTVNVMIAIIVFYLGKFIIRKLYQIVRRILLRRNVESSLSSFILSFVRIVLYFILIVTVIGILGIETSSFLAIFASAGVAIGMALSGTLQNFAGGVLILLLKPYRVGDYIDTQGYQGEVKEIQIFHTVLLTFDNKSIIIPNGGLSTGSVNNWSKERFRRVDWNVAISYGDSVDTAREAVLEILDANPLVVKKYTSDFHMPSDRPASSEDTMGESSDCCDSTSGDTDEDDMVADNGSCTNADADGCEESQASRRQSILDFFRSRKERIERYRQAQQKKAKSHSAPKDCSPSVVLNELGDSSVNLKVRAWVPTASYWTVYYSVLEEIYETLPSKGINFPFPQLDIHCIHPNYDNTSTHDIPTAS